MGMCAEIVGIGSYSKSVSCFLDYRSEFYATTLEGAVVSRRLFGIEQGSSLSRTFAALLGIADPWDFNQHKLIPSRIDLVGLREFGKQYPEYREDVHTLEALLQAGFEFHFRPEG
jgi:hypothetical protein